MNPIQYWPANPPFIPFYFSDRTLTFFGRVPEIPTRAGIDGGNELKRSRILDSAGHSRYLYLAVLHRLPHGFQNIPRKLGHLIQKENAKVSQRNLTGHRLTPASDQSRHTGRVMRRAKRSSSYHRLSGTHKARRRINS